MRTRRVGDRAGGTDRPCSHAGTIVVLYESCQRDVPKSSCERQRACHRQASTALRKTEIAASWIASASATLHVNRSVALHARQAGVHPFKWGFSHVENRLFTHTARNRPGLPAAGGTGASPVEPHLRLGRGQRQQ